MKIIRVTCTVFGVKQTIAIKARAALQKHLLITTFLEIEVLPWRDVELAG